MTPRRCDVVVVGAGLAGLAAAIHLLDAGRDVHVIEAADGVGGRVRTDHIDGLTLDRGFQLYNTGYQAGRELLDLAALDMRPLSGGVTVALDGGQRHLGDPRYEPAWALESLLRPVAPRGDLVRFAMHALGLTRNSRGTQVDESAQAFLRRTFGPELTDRVLQPFLAGVVLDDTLATSRHHVDRLLRAFVTGRPSLPSRGMSAIPQQLAGRLGHERIHLDTRVTRVSPGSVGTDDGDILCDAVVVAADPRSANSLVGAIGRPEMRDVTTWYHLADCSGTDLTVGRGTMLVDGQRFNGSTADAARPLANSVVLTNAVAEYATGSRVLVSSSAVGRHESATDDDVVREHLARMHGVSTSGWTLAARYVVPDSLPATPPGRARELAVDLGEGLYVAGDHRDAASIDGALASGRRAAHALLAG